MPTKITALFLALGLAGCATQPENPWFVPDEYITTDIVVSPRLHQEFIQVSEQTIYTDPEAANSTRGQRCLNTDANVGDPGGAVAFYLLVQLPICAVAILLDTGNDDPGAGDNDPPRQIEGATAPPTLAMTQEYEEYLTSIVDLNLMLDVGNKTLLWKFLKDTGAISAHIVIDNFQFQPADSTDAYQFYLAGTFCIDDKLARFPAYAGRSEATGDSYTRQEWMDKDVGAIREEIKTVGAHLAWKIRERLTTDVVPLQETGDESASCGVSEVESTESE